MRLTPLTALLLLACSTSTPTTSPGGDTSTSVGSSAEALRKQRQLDADDVERCRDLVAQCPNEDGSDDAGPGRGCERLAALCDQLEERLNTDRADLEQCLEAAATCEAAATDPADCEAERAACEPTDRDFRDRRGRTLECSGRAEQCFGRGRGRGPADADAGAGVCEAGDDDFIGCCQGKHGRPGERGDGGVDNDRGPGFGGRPDLGAGPFGRGDPDRGGDRGDDGRGDKGDDDADAGPPRRRF